MPTISKESYEKLQNKLAIYITIRDFKNYSNHFHINDMLGDKITQKKIHAEVKCNDLGSMSMLKQELTNSALRLCEAL